MLFGGGEHKFYCLGAGDNIKLIEYIKIISESIDASIPLKIGKISYDANVIPCAKIDLTTLHEDTGYIPKIKFRDGIKRIIQEVKDE